MYYPFPDNLKRLRKAAKMSQYELADRIGVNQSTVSTYEAGLVYPTIDRLYDIARVLSVDITELVR